MLYDFDTVLHIIIIGCIVESAEYFLIKFIFLFHKMDNIFILL